MRSGLIVGLLAVALSACAAHAQDQRIALEPIVEEGLSSPLFVTHAGDGTGRLFVLERAGRIRIINARGLRAAPFLDITDRVVGGGERGLLGLAFHPNYVENGRFFVNYSRRGDGATVIAEYKRSADPGFAARRERVLLTIKQPFGNHNGGMIAFDLRGRLFIATGDGGSGADPENNGQDKTTLLGKILRIDVDGARPYAVPPGNPFVGRPGRDEIYALGLRNPWRFSFDREDGTLYVGDVGQNRVEEVDVIERGGNYGWRIMEGSTCFKPRRGCDRRGLALPVTEYRHVQGRCSVTGGYVYRGQALPSLNGVYVFGDFCNGQMFALENGRRSVLLDTDLAIASFGEDEEGELLVVDLNGAILRIVPPAP